MLYYLSFLILYSFNWCCKLSTAQFISYTDSLFYLFPIIKIILLGISFHLVGYNACFWCDQTKHIRGFRQVDAGNQPGKKLEFVESSLW